MKPIIQIIITLLVIAPIACKEETKPDRKDRQNAYIDAIPIPQKSILEVIIDSRLHDHRDVYNWDLRNLKEVKASALLNVPESQQVQNMGYDPKVHGFTNAQIFNVSPFYESDILKAGIFFGPKAREVPSLHLQTSLPLAFEDRGVWGFLDEQSHTWYMDNLREYFEASSESIWVVDFTYSRLQEAFYWTIGRLDHLKSLSLPFHGVDFSSEELVFPASLERLVVYNTRICKNFGEKIKHLTSLEELIFVGCWLDTHSSQPHWGNDNFEELNQPIQSTLEPPVHPYNRIHNNLVTLKLIDCDRKLLIATDYYTWPQLNELEIVQTFEYPSGDGVWAFDYLKLEPNNSPHIHKDYFYSLSKVTIRNSQFGIPLSDEYFELVEQQLKEANNTFSIPDNKDFTTWTSADNLELQLRQRFDRNKFNFNYTIKHIR